MTITRAFVEEVLRKANGYRHVLLSTAEKAELARAWLALDDLQRLRRAAPPPAQPAPEVEWARPNVAFPGRKEMALAAWPRDLCADDLEHLRHTLVLILDHWISKARVCESTAKDSLGETARPNDLNLNPSLPQEGGGVRDTDGMKT
jgi:hypothetical protein